MGWRTDETYAKVVGAKIIGVTKHSDYQVDLNLEDGRTLGLPLEGDCCSSSFYTDLAQFDELVGTTIQSIEERSGESRDGLEAALAKEEENYDTGCRSWHFLVVETNKGHTTIDWRNESNGYYDGWVEAVLFEAEAPTLTN